MYLTVLKSVYKGELTTALQVLCAETRQSLSNTSQVPSDEVKLPRITLPNLGGDYTKWQPFHDLFITLIDKNGSPTDVQKLHYLKTSLNGDAEILLRQFPITGENYTQAWDTLKKRYDNKRFIANYHFKKFFDQKALVQESATAIRQLLDTSVQCLNTLRNLELPTTEWDAIVIYTIVSKLDPESRKNWEKLVNEEVSTSFPSFEKLKLFLENRFRTLEMVEPVNKNHKSTNAKAFHVTAYNDSGDIQCSFCKEKHHVHNCKQFANLPVDERYVFVKMHRLCFNCLIPTHTVWQCKQRKTCQVCKRRHHSLLHRGTKQLEQRQENKKVYNMTIKRDSNVVAHVRQSTDSEHTILLPTALVNVASECGRPQVCRALIRQGSEASFVTARVVELLKLKKTANSNEVPGISEDSNMCIQNKVDLQIWSKYEPDFTVKVKALPARNIDCKKFPQLDKMKLADPTFTTPSGIDIILGADVYGKIIDSGFMRGQGEVVAQLTHLGWILSGDVNTASDHLQKTLCCHHTLSQVEKGKAKFKQKFTHVPAASVRPHRTKVKNKVNLFSDQT